MISLTLFTNLYDNTTKKRVDFTSWDKFEELLYSLSKAPGYKVHKGTPIPEGVKPSPLISPAAYSEDSTRCNASVSEWAGWCAVDVDELVFTDVQKEVVERFGQYTFCCYSTASSTKEHPKFRLVFPLKVNPSNKDIKHFWYALNMELGEISDPQTKDLSRMYYIPADYPNAYNFIFSNTGDYINPFEIMAKHEYVAKQSLSVFDRMPEAIRKAILAERASKLTNTDYHWTYYDNCPFLSRSMISDYQAISGTGWYHQSYKIMLSIASSAVRRGYPITSDQIAILCKQMDSSNSITRERYKGRNYLKEAERALEFVMAKI